MSRPLKNPRDYLALAAEIGVVIVVAFQIYDRFFKKPPTPAVSLIP